MIERYLLRYFLAVMERGNFTRAAESCNVTQSALSTGIARLEAEVGGKLFRRTNRRVDLTPAGVRFAAHAREIEQGFQRAERAVESPSPAKLLRLGVLATIPVALIAEIARHLAVQVGVQVELVEGRPAELRERLGVGRIDMALTLEPGSGPVVFEPVHSEGYGLAMPVSHPLAGESAIEGQRLADNVMIVRRQCEVLTQTSQYFTQRGVRPFFVARTVRDDHALAYVAAGLGITVMPDAFCAPGVARVTLAGFNPVRTIGVQAVRKDDAFALCVEAAAAAFARLDSNTAAGETR